jgi:hypothetical protein
MILGNAMGDMIGSNFQNGSTAGNTTMEVDWVRAYQFGDHNPTPALEAAPAPVAESAAASAPAPAPAPEAAETPAPASAPVASNDDTGSGSDQLTLRVSGDAGHGDPQFVVKVDGQQVGDLLSVTASHDAGQWQDVTLNGTFGSGQHQVEVSFVNDGTDGSHATDTNLYVGGVGLNGQHVDGSAFASNDASLGYDALDGGAAVMVVNGTASYQVADAGGELVLRVSGDDGHGDPQFAVEVDGQQVGDLLSVTASHDAGQWQDIPVDLGAIDLSEARDLSIRFVNDGTDGPHATDTNLYVAGLELNGQYVQGNAFASNDAALGHDAIEPNAAVMVANGTATYNASDYWQL